MKYTDIEHIPRIVESLRETFNSGITKDKEYRKQQLKQLKLFLQTHERELYDTVYKDLHKHPLETMSGEIAPILSDIDFMLKNLDKLCQPVSVKAHYKMNMLDKNMIRKEPKGVVLIIGPWNYPVHLPLLPVVGAIAAGNCIVLKPSELSQHTSQFLAEHLPNYLDNRSFRIVMGGIDEAKVVLDQKFDHIFFTGNGVVGKVIMMQACKHLTPVTLELGGKSPAVIAPDANLSIAVNRILFGKFYNGGQTCVAPDYVMIQKQDVDQFVDTCRQVIRERYGNDPQQSDSYGRMIGEKRFHALKEILDSVDPQKVLIGGQTDQKDLYIAPTVVSPVDAHDPMLMEQEIFGPILPVVPVEDMDEAIRIIQTKDSPLVVYLFTEDKSTRNKFMDNTKSGAVLVNDTLMHVLESSLPFGGVGGSGMGSYHGIKSFDTFSYERSLMIKSSGLEMVMKARYPPYNDDKKLMFALLTLGLPDTITEKVKFIFKVCGSTYRVLFSKSTKQ
ncbi:hypothetical protein G6F70_006718 [Rhizopus microsporus]|nr:hypothetical protein G6F71_006683 [Rhizopus microsporus]KAG1197317.1 hypothetical protein G6F70_006718 [Rhizopus microsporus]KAG1209138.1 hypothetical protein G6F69_006618 [Rhizopus microsporus]KAG1230478.1 hypothetical protein G6F67_006436 [Rhizopus microsporus]KAG1262799.1 hypothetical protein G6F68_005646 [Rhizopus microsporus]